MTQPIEHLEEIANNLLAEIEKLKGKAEDPPKSWPQMGDEYWHLDTWGRGWEGAWEGAGFDTDRRSMGNIFRTEQEALDHARRLRIEAELRRRAGGFKPDWGDDNQEKWCVYFDHDSNQLRWRSYLFSQQQGTIHFPTEDATLLKEMHDDLVWYFTGKEAGDDKP